MGRAGGRVVVAAALLAGAQLAAPRWAVAADRPLYFDRLVTEADLDNRSADELRLMRNTVFARAGRTFDDPALRDYFSRQPWYRPAVGPSRKLSALEQKNLAGIKLWEKHAKAWEDLHRLLPGFGDATPKPARYECGTDAQHALRDKREQRRLVLEAGRLSWADVPSFADALDSVGTKIKVVRVACGPDIDADGSPEAVVTMTRPYEIPTGEGNPEEMSIDLVFLASRRGTKWRAVAPLGIHGSIPGVEGSTGTFVSFVTLADGRRGLAVERSSGGGGDCDCDTERISVATLEHGKLKPRGTFETGRPCQCEYAGD